MVKASFSVYLGEENESDFLGFIAENNLFLIIECPDFDKERGRIFLKEISGEIVINKPASLAGFEELLTKKIHQANLPLGFSLAAGYLTENKFYLKTYNEGEIYLKRGNQFAKIITGNITASGFIKENDFFVFSTRYFDEVLGGTEKIKRSFDHKKPHEIIEELTPEIKGKEDSRAVALLVNFNAETDEILNQDQQSESFISKIKNDFFRLNNLPENYRKKKYTLVFVFVIVLILIWSVGLGVQRRQEAARQKEISTVKELITKKLKQADDAAFLNLSEATGLISEAKTELNNLKKNKALKNRKELSDLEKLISSEESKLYKREEKSYEEFFDLAIENKNVSGVKLALDKENLIVLDSNKGSVYNLSLTKKSLDKNTSSEFKSTSLIAGYDNDIFSFVPKDGVYKLADGKSKKVINNDKDWKEIIDLKVYNGNIYLLDKDKDEVYKYLVAETGYSDKQSYFASGSAIDLSAANSMAIDSAVYLGFSDYVAKYISGVRDAFKTDFPEENPSLTKVFTTKDLDKVYVWDKTHGTLYVLAKNGSYEKQIKSSIFTKGQDIVVFEDAVYILYNQKIYKVDL